ncbi:hypothetical protein M2275_005785 [Rhodococcus opacus]|nr:hypothetical protein [Rhodococcus opacus]
MTLDRYGEARGAAKAFVAPHDPRCRTGWLGEDSEGRMIPCLVCKPHLRPQESREVRD